MTADGGNPNPEDFLRLGGLPLELTVVGAFKAVGADVFHADYYPDIVTGKQREIDVIATLETTTPAGAPIRLSYVIECKAGGRQPWVVCDPLAQNLSAEHIFEVGFQT